MMLKAIQLHGAITPDLSSRRDVVELENERAAKSRRGTLNGEEEG